MCQTAYFYFSCLGWIITSQDLPCLFPCFAEPLTALLQPQWKVCARPYKAITIWKQWASERDDSSRQQSSYHSGCKRDIAEREHAIIWMPSWKAETMHSLARRIIARRSPNICDYTGTDFINMLLSSPGSQISESLFKARTASLKARKGEHIHKRRLLFGCCFFNTLFGAAESNPGLFTLSVLAPGRSGARANQIRSAWNNSSPASPTQVISCHFQLNPGEDNLRWGSSQKKKILSALSVENPKPRSLSSFKDKVKKMKITFKLYLLI